MAKAKGTKRQAGSMQGKNLKLKVSGVGAAMGRRKKGGY